MFATLPAKEQRKPNVLVGWGQVVTLSVFEPL